MRCVLLALGQFPRTPDEKQQPCQKHERIDGDEPQSDARAAERVNGKIAQEAASCEKRAVKRKRIGEDGGEMREREVRRTRARHREQVDESARCQPRHERGILHGIPAPPAAPAEHLVRPEGADEDARAEERPGDERPVSRKREPRRAVRLFRQQRPQGRRIRHGEQGIAEEDKRRMHRHPRVLQEGIHACTIGRRITLRHEERAVEEDERGQERLQEEEHRLTCVPEPFAKGERRARRRMEEEPQEERSLLPRPEGGNLVDERQVERGVAPHIVNVEAIVQDQPEEPCARQSRGQERGESERLAHCGLLANPRESRRQRKDERERQEHRAERHDAPPFIFSYFDGHLMSRRSASNTPSLYEPTATMWCAERNWSGSVP